MDKANWRKVKNTLKRWRPGDYIRQLSVVVIGIIITFTGSDLISSCSQRRELRQTMEMVKQELEDNHKVLKEIRQRLAREHRVFNMVLDYRDDFSKIPIDSMNRHFSIFGNYLQYTMSTYAMDVLKSSRGVQQVESRYLLRNLFACYDKLKAAQECANGYYNDKNKAGESALYKFQVSDFNKMLDGDVKTYWLHYLSDDKTRNFFMNAAVGYLETVLYSCTEAEQALDQTLEMIDKEYK